MATDLYIERFAIPTKGIDDNEDNLDINLKKHIAKELKIDEDNILDYKIIQKSIDSRKKGSLLIIYKLILTVNTIDNIIEENPNISTKLPEDTTDILNSLNLTTNKPETTIVVGAGPAGLLAAYLLVKNGVKVTLIDRGYDVEKRKEDINNFLNTRELNTESNFINGEGGAGTFSDGKLYTRIKNPRAKWILELFVAMGAPEEIIYLSHPHVGSDKLVDVVSNIRKEIIKLGGNVLWGTKVVDTIQSGNNCIGVKLDSGEELKADKVILAMGHSSRSLIKQLVSNGVEHQLKNFQIGTRIEHPQIFINRMRYGLRNTPKYLKPAEYNLVSRPNPKHNIANVTTFCMCPGGEVVPATSHANLLSTNGMSYYDRAGEFANSALIVNQEVDNYKSAEEAFQFIEKIEHKCFKAGGEDYTAPTQSAEGFIEKYRHIYREESSYALGTKEARIDYLFPKRTVKAIAESLRYFDKIAPGFIGCGMLIGAETRISSPVRFLRDKETAQTSIENLYIAGEGGGFAGGIISAALDGLKIAELILTETYIKK